MLNDFDNTSAFISISLSLLQRCMTCRSTAYQYTSTVLVRACSVQLLLRVRNRIMDGWDVLITLRCFHEYLIRVLP